MPRHLGGYQAGVATDVDAGAVGIGAMAVKVNGQSCATAEAPKAQVTAVTASSFLNMASLPNDRLVSRQDLTVESCKVRVFEVALIIPEMALIFAGRGQI